VAADVEQKDFSLLDMIARSLATGGGVGLSPKAPGTLGALEGVALFLLFIFFRPDAVSQSSGPFLQLAIVNLTLFAAGVWAASRVCRLSGCGDPQTVVIDEISGQLIGLMPLASAASISGVAAGFVLFRLFDILKPWPIKRLERLHGGLGVMADDALAGLFTAALLWIGRHYSIV
jgi:phosphatidylglycerophosphatase A